MSVVELLEIKPHREEDVFARVREKISFALAMLPATPRAAQPQTAEQKADALRRAEEKRTRKREQRLAMGAAQRAMRQTHTASQR